PKPRERRSSGPGTTSPPITSSASLFPAMRVRFASLKKSASDSNEATGTSRPTCSFTAFTGRFGKRSPPRTILNQPFFFLRKHQRLLLRREGPFRGLGVDHESSQPAHQCNSAILTRSEILLPLTHS